MGEGGIRWVLELEVRRRVENLGDCRGVRVGDDGLLDAGGELDSL